MQFKSDFLGIFPKISDKRHRFYYFFLQFIKKESDDFTVCLIFVNLNLFSCNLDILFLVIYA